MSAAQAGILLLSLLWPFLFIKSDCLLLKGLSSPRAHYSGLCVFDETHKPFQFPATALIQLILEFQMESKEQNLLPPPRPPYIYTQSDKK